MILPCFITICLALCTDGLKLHEEMTNDEIKSTFDVDEQNSLDHIEYEVTPLHHEEHPDNQGQKVRRSRSTIQFQAFETSIFLDLLENDNTLLGSATPLLLARSSPDGTIHYSRQQFPVSNNLKFYHDREKRAALAMFTDENNKIHMSGTIGEEYVVKPVPARLQKNMLENSTLHFVIKRSPDVNSPTRSAKAQFYDLSSNYQSSWRPQPITQEQAWQGSSISQRPVGQQNANVQYSDIMYPKILVVVDYSTFEKHGRDINELSKYMAAFWNSVDLRFRELTKPQVRLNIAGLIVPQTARSAPYFEDGLIHYETLEAGKFLSEIQNNFEQNRPLDKSAYDIVFGITTRDLQHYTRDSPDGKALGVARLAAACEDRGTAVVTDKGYFKGMTTAAHELGHSFGAYHDGDPTDYHNYPGGPCPRNGGYLMSIGESRIGKKAFRWSQCSQIAMREFLTSPQAQCMINRPNVGTPYPKLLPGKILSRNQQCSKSFGNGFVSVGQEKDCIQLWCQYPGSSSNSPMIPAEGTPCGKGSICLGAECVQDPSASQYTPGVGTSYPKIQSGRVPSRDEQCSKLKGPNYFSVKSNERDCQFLWCQQPGASNSFALALEEGSSCGPGSVCRNKQCVRG